MMATTSTRTMVRMSVTISCNASAWVWHQAEYKRTGTVPKKAAARPLLRLTTSSLISYDSGWAWEWRPAGHTAKMEGPSLPSEAGTPRVCVLLRVLEGCRTVQKSCRTATAPNRSPTRSALAQQPSCCCRCRCCRCRNRHQATPWAPASAPCLERECAAVGKLPPPPLLPRFPPSSSALRPTRTTAGARAPLATRCGMRGPIMSARIRRREDDR